MKNFIFIFIGLSFSAMAQTQIDKSEDLNGVHLESSKTDAVRQYQASISKTIHFPLQLVKIAVTNFSDKCNNSLKDKRKFSSKEADCKYHNEHFIESFVVKDVWGMENFKDFKESYILGRQIYNRGSFGFYELVQIQEGQNSLKQKTITITLKMLEDEEVKSFASPKFKKESAFDSSSASYVLTEISPNETSLEYRYTAETDHWLLNKEISVPQVFASISKSVNELVVAVEAESSSQKRELASED